ncbi:MAG: hypothetical protein EXS13_07610 [Planctomycetes bacterium]|nr:hypothetical protein [Planctomycetota bacterium]
MTSRPDANPPIDRNDSVRQVVRALFAYRFTAIWFFGLFFGFLLLIGYWFPPIYLAKALILVKPGREQLPQSIVPIAQAPSGNLTATVETVNSEISILTSRPVLEVVVDRLLAEQEKKPDNFLTRFQDWCRAVGLLPDLPQRENMILSLGEKIDPEPLPMTNVIEIEFTSFNDRAACKTVDYLVDAYLAQHSKVHSNPAALHFFGGEAERVRAELDLVTADLVQFRADNDGGDLTLKRTLLLQELTSTESRRRALDQIPEGSEELASTVVADNPAIAEGRKLLLDRRLELATLTQQFGKTARETEGVRAQLALASGDLRKQLERLHVVLASSEERLRADLRAAELKRAVYDRLVEDETRLRRGFDLFQQKAEEERIFQQMDSDQMVSVRVIERPTIPQKPWFPNAFILALLGIVLGVPGALSAALLRAWLAGRVATVHDVEEKLQVPVLASIAKPRLWDRADARAATMGDAARVVLASLARRAGEPPPPGAGRVVHVAAASEREGADAFAAALAHAAGDDGRAVALVSLGERSDSQRGPVGANGAAVDCAKLQASGRVIEGARNVTLFDLAQQPLAALPELLLRLRETSALVVIAGTPLCGRGDGARHVGLADIALLVVGAGQVHFEVARRAHEIMRREARQFAGAVLTGRPEPVPGLVYRWI